MTKIKICGNTNLEDAKLAAALGADYVGFVFYEKSARFIEPEKVAAIIKRLPEDVRTVGVFVNEDLEEVRRVRELCDLDYVQLQGDESPEYCNKLENVIKTFRIKNADCIKSLNDYDVDFYLFDSESPLYGGSGRTFDWSLIKGIRGDFFLAGGLNPENVVGAIETVRPYAVDVASGVEIKPGEKDTKKLKLFIERVKGIRR